REPVRASQRIYTWTSPWAIKHREALADLLPSAVLDDADSVMKKSFAPNTLTSYAAGPLRFTQYCDLRNIPEDQRMPASEILIAGFVGYHCGKVSGSCIKNWLSGLKAWFEFHGAAWPGDTPEIKMARYAAKKEGTAHKRASRHPISTNHLHTLHRALDFRIPFHCAIWALAVTAFRACRRLGELTIPSLNGFNPTYHATRDSASLTFSSKHLDSAHFHIPWTKTTKSDGANIVVTGLPSSHPDSALCAVAALRQHWSANSKVPGTFSLFAFIDSDGKPQHMRKSVFLNFCYSIWQRAGMQHVLGHSFRIGGAVDLLLAGVAPEVVAATGGWTSLAFLLYWRRLEHLLPLHIAQAYDKRKLEDIHQLMERYRETNKIPKAYLDIEDSV
ncbi:hypothetical protein EV360DRAFT_48092, partial [Lentinula raphanica]